ncbi:hypothetical protein Ancab_011878 [Ancistrocladus abbreviatus]
MAIRFSMDKESDQVTAMLKKLGEYEKDPNIKLIILKGNGKAFCAGGDVQGTIQTATAGHWSYPTIFYGKQLKLDYLVATYKKPVVSLFDGVVMGGGAGLSMHTTFRIVTEKAVFAMPEAAIGLFTDVGASYFLSRLPGYIGEYLGLTGARLTGGEMFACGLATHFVTSKDLPLLENKLEKLGSNASSIGEIVKKYSQQPCIKEDSPCMSMELINKCFSKNTVEEVLQALLNEKDAHGAANKWIVNGINSMKQACPLSLKISLRLIREGRGQTLAQCLNRDYIVLGNTLSRRIGTNFYEGGRAMLIDKDMKPKWEPSKLELVSNEMVDRYFIQLDDEDVKPLQLPVAATSSQEFTVGHARL